MERWLSYKIELPLLIKLKTMKTLLTLIFLSILVTSCMPTVESRVHECVILDKHHDFFTGYWFESVNGTSVLYIQVSRKEYKYYEAGDTIK